MVSRPLFDWTTVVDIDARVAQGAPSWSGRRRCAASASAPFLEGLSVPHIFPLQSRHPYFPSRSAFTEQSPRPCFPSSSSSISFHSHAPGSRTLYQLHRSSFPLLSLLTSWSRPQARMICAYFLAPGTACRANVLRSRLARFVLPLPLSQKQAWCPLENRGIHLVGR